MSEMSPEQVLGLYTDDDTVLIRCVGGPHDGQEVRQPRTVLYGALALPEPVALSFDDYHSDPFRLRMHVAHYRAEAGPETSWYPALADDGRYLFRYTWSG